MPIWAAVSDVAARLTYETLDASSSPTDTQVEAWLNEFEARIRSVLRAAGLSTVYAPGSDAELMLRGAVADYGEGRVRMSWGSGTGGSQDDLMGQSMLGKSEQFIEDLRTRSIQLGSELDPAGDVADSVQYVQSHVTDNADSLTVENGDFAPRFHMDEVDY